MDQFSPEVETASENFTKVLPMFKTLVKNTDSRKSLIRVINALAEFPLGAGYPKLLNENEKRLFSLFQEMTTYKSTILTGFLQAEITNDEGENNERNIE